MVSAEPASTMFGMLDGRMAKLGMLQPMARMAAMPMRPFEPFAKPHRSASAMPIGTITTARPTEDGMRNPSSIDATISPPMRRG